MFLLKQLLPVSMVAALIAGVVLVIAARFRKGGAWAGAVALGLSYAGGHAMTAGWPALPPADVTYWLLYFSLAAMLLGVIDAQVRAPGWSRVGIWALFCAGLLYLLLRPKFQNGWTLVPGLSWMVGLTAGMILLAWLWQSLSARIESSALAPLLAAMIAGGTSVALMLSGSILLGQLAMVLAAALGAVMAICWFLPGLPFAQGTVPVLTALLIGLWLSGYFYADLPAVSAALLFAAPVTALVPLPMSAAGKRNALFLHIGMVLAPVVIAVIIAVHASPPLDY